MDVGVRAARQQVAHQRLLAAAETLARRHGLEGAHDAIEAAGRGPQSRDAVLMALFQEEAVADLLEGLVVAGDPQDAAAAEAERPRVIRASKGAKG